MMDVANEENTNIDEQEQLRQKLLWNVKREVKQMMEEAVTKKCIHEENCSITTLSAAVEACLLHGLKRRAVGLFKTSTTTALLQKIAKTCPEAAEVVKIIDDDNRQYEESSSLLGLSRKLSIITHHQPSTSDDNNRRQATRSVANTRYLWIRKALIHRSLHKIVEHIVNNSSKYYEPYALVCNSVQGPILASLLVGPCALEFTRVKTSDHLWTDPHADELVQRHRMHGSNRTMTSSSAMMMHMNPSSKQRPSLQINLKRHASSSSDEAQKHTQLMSTNPARDYVESLHQNAKSQLIYGKNNVYVQPVPTQEPIPGYLSLHHSHNGLTLKWTPNQLMNGYTESTKSSQTNSQGTNETDPNNTTESPRRHSVYWEYAISINLSSIVYLHCHHYVDGDRIVFVGRDGVQYPPFHIKDQGGHLLAFLTCLETGLAPNGQLDPPLAYEKGQGKVLPKLHRRSERPQPSISLSSNDDDMHAHTPTDKGPDDISSATGDYVFRIIFFSDHESLNSSGGSNRNQWPIGTAESPTFSSQSSSSSPSAQIGNAVSSQSGSPMDATFATSAVYISPTTGLHKSISVRSSMASLCDTMRRQILSRAFYGWLAYCRHLKTVRTHLTSLVNPVLKAENNEKLDPALSLTAEGWAELFLVKQKDNLLVDKKEIYRRIYSGGCEPSIRRQVWPYLFSHYPFESTMDERIKIDHTTTERYHQLTSEWRGAEEIVMQIEIQHSNNRKNTLAKLLNFTSETTHNATETTLTSIKNVLASIPEKISFTHHNALERKDSALSNDVFYEECSVHTVAIPIIEESASGQTASGENRLLSSSSNPSVLIARTHMESVIDRASPYNIIDTSTDMDDVEEDDTHIKPIEPDETSLNEQESQVEPKPLDIDNHLSPSSSLTSGTDVYMDAVEILSDENHNDRSDGTLTPICYGSFTKEVIDAFSVNLHRIDKDVARCDRTYAYFTNINNLKKLRNIMCTYVWDNLATGYIQGMCDLVAPLLVVFDEEVMAYSCFCYLMKRLLPNFPHGAGMDEHFGHMRSLLQILDFELYEHIHRTGDFTHFYFCYRWFLLDFKREFIYEDIFLVWETIAAARRTVSKRFVLFIALAMLKTYREIILDNRMDFTDIIRFFNEMAERHDTREILRIARELVLELQKLVDNK